MFKNVIAICAVVLCSGTLILESNSTHVSSSLIMSDKEEYVQGESIVVSGWVKYNNEATSDVLLKVLAKGPQDLKIFEGYVTSGIDGTFALKIPIPHDASAGTYEIDVTSMCREIHRDVCTHQYEKMSVTVGNAVESLENKIPGWIKNIFVWYAEDKVSEEELLGAIEFLASEGIIRIS